MLPIFKNLAWVAMYLKCSCYRKIFKFSTWEKKDYKLLLIKWAVAELYAGCYLNSHSEKIEVRFQEGMERVCCAYNYVRIQSEAWHN